MQVGSGVLRAVDPHDMVPPHDMDAERAVIGAMLVSEQAQSVVTDILKPEDFYSETHRRIYAAMYRLMGEGTPIDRLTVSEELKDIQGEEPQRALLRLVESVPLAANADQWALIVRNKAQLRRLIDAGTKVVQMGFSANGHDPADIIDAAEQEVYNVGDDGEDDAKLEHPAHIMDTVLGEVNENFKNGGAMPGLSCGYEDIDDMTMGYNPGDLVIIAARPAMGKTALALNQCWKISRRGTPTAIFSLEMDRKQLIYRLLAREARVKYQDLKAGNLSEEEMVRVVNASGVIRNTPIYINDTGAKTIPAIRARIRRLRSRLKSSGQQLGLVAIDYLGLMETTRHYDSAYLKTTELSKAVKSLARDLELPVLLLAQLSRACEQRNDKRPILSDLRDSGAIEQDADVVMFLYRDEYYNPQSDDKGIVEVIIGKQRNGPTGTVDLAFMLEQQRMETLSKRYKEG